MRLAGEEDLHRPLRLVEQALEPVRLAEEQGRPLVGREPAGEADRERRGSRSCRAASAISPSRGAPAPLLLDELRRGGPPTRRALRRLVGAATARRGPASSGCSSTPVAAISRRRPGGRVDAVGDRLDRDFRERQRPASRRARACARRRACRRETAFWRVERRSASTAIEKSSRDWSSGTCAAELEELVEGDAVARRRSPPKYFQSSPARTRRCPAGTGVWVVKTLPAVATSRASAKERPLLGARRRMRSSRANAAWPSLMCRTVGLSPSDSRARMPPIPRTSSWLEPHLDAAAVEPVRDLPVGRLVLRQVRVEKQQRRAPDCARAGRARWTSRLAIHRGHDRRDARGRRERPRPEGRRVDDRVGLLLLRVRRRASGGRSPRGRRGRRPRAARRGRSTTSGGRPRERRGRPSRSGGSR